MIKKAAHERFFRSERPAAVLKHAILQQYVVPFVSKTGSTSTDGRVVYVDGYAGRGRSEDGVDGSPALIAAAARTVSEYRRLECHFVEKDKSNHTALRAMLQAEADDLVWETYEGTVEQHLDALLRVADGVPLFMFLDPFGFAISFDDVVNKIYGRPWHQYSPGTEVLLNFSANAVRRTAGILDSTKDNPAAPKQMAALDRMCGGGWWREIWRDREDNEDFVNKVAARYLHEINEAVGCAGVTLDVRNREDLAPVYHLVFLTRHMDGIYKFADASSLAQAKWRRAVFDETTDFDDDGGMFDADAMFADQEAALARRWHRRLRRNVEGLLDKHERFSIGKHFFEVYDGVLGEAREKHLRAVLAELHTERKTSSDKKGELVKKVVVRA